MDVAKTIVGLAKRMEHEEEIINFVEIMINIEREKSYSIRLCPVVSKPNHVHIIFKNAKFTFHKKEDSRVLAMTYATIMDQIFRDYLKETKNDCIESVVVLQIEYKKKLLFRDELIPLEPIDVIDFTETYGEENDTGYYELKSFLERYFEMILKLDFDS